ncbi:MAG: sigma-54 dependent transcriptional regulator [Desulfobulbaceae bacterium]|nr:sigma-54 dependent transcriptional regulator [Desulfobulbaceae bacterium]
MNEKYPNEGSGDGLVNAPPLIMVVDDDLYLLSALRQTLTLGGYGARTFASPREALASLENCCYAAALADIRMPEMSGMALLEAALAKDPDLPVILITGHGDVAMAVEAIKKGAYHFLQKPVDDDIIFATLERAIERRRLVVENRRLERQVLVSRQDRVRFCGLTGGHPLMLELYAQIEAIAPEKDPVLIIGETGVGKELVAQALHHLGCGEGTLYVAVNMGAMPSEMIESELFGHEKGAFTGASAKKIGKFEYAGAGTLFLDEICSMPLHVQAKLLRVLEERAFTRLGGNTMIPLKSRVIAATNRDLVAEIKKRNFREDLYFRLNVLPVTVPPLRHHRQDIPLLVGHFWEEYCADGSHVCRDLPVGWARSLMARDWPGNVRELRNYVRRTCVLGSKEGLTAEDGEAQTLPTSNLSATLAATAAKEPSNLRWKDFMARQERSYLEEILKENGGQVNIACRRMAISRKSLYDKINKYQINLGAFRGKGKEGGELPGDGAGSKKGKKRGS